MGGLQSWAAEAATEFGFGIACDIARAFAAASPPAVDDLPCDEVLVEWGARPFRGVT